MDRRSFDEVLKIPDKIVVVKFFRPTCPHCMEFAPVFLSLGNAFIGHDKVIIAEVDCSANGNVCGSQGISSVPTVKVFSRHGSQRVYQGNRSLEDLKRFVESILKER